MWQSLDYKQTNKSVQFGGKRTVFPKKDAEVTRHLMKKKLTLTSTSHPTHKIIQSRSHT